MASDQDEYAGERADSAPEGLVIELVNLSRVSLEPDDVVVLRHPKRVDQADAARLVERMGHVFPGHKVVILDAGLELAVVRPVIGDAS